MAIEEKEAPKFKYLKNCEIKLKYQHFDMKCK